MSSIAENNIDLHLGNMKGIPVMARTGSEDENVPPFHTRRMVRLLSELEELNQKIVYILSI